MKKTFQKRSALFKIGVGFIVFWSAVIGFFNVAVFYWFGIPILGLLLGIIFVWFSKENIKAKLLSTLISFPVILAAFGLFFLILPKAEPETFFIPQNFRGQFEVIFDEPCGQSLNYENGRRIYRIPDGGVLITNAKQTMGVIDRKFYLKDDAGGETELPEFHWSKFEREKDDWHWSFSKTNLSKDLVGIFWAYQNNFSFIVSDYEALEQENKSTKAEKQKLFQNTADSLLKECRKNK